MEKKANRSVQPASKGLTTEAKKSQDASNKLWPRGSRRRELAGGPPAKNERKPPPQRSKATDKRPRSRGLYSPGVACGKESARVDKEEEGELGSVFNVGGKKQSLNHLLNFHFEPRERQLHARGAANTSKSGRGSVTTYKHKYNKEQFLQANCQFVVKEAGEYKLYMNNPDALVDWDSIEQVNVHVSEFPCCPICLYTPVAAKITRCGHIYCWSCMLHYLALSDKPIRNCPICYESVNKNDLKSVTAIPHSSFNVNETIRFRLMKRVRGSLTAYPIDQDIQEDGTIFHISDTGLEGIYSKLLLANPSEVSRIVQRERHELEAQMRDDADCPEKCFIHQALALIVEREEKSCKGHSTKTMSNDHDLTVHDYNLNASSELDDTDNQDLIDSIDSLDITSKETHAKVFYFYQACDGQHLYLHPLNVRMLENTYGSLEFSPKTLSGRIVEKETGSMTNDLRNRLRCLQHLPLTCQFDVAEIQMKSPLISDETVALFHEQVDARRRRRQKRARDEKKREKKIAEEEGKRFGKFPSASLHLESHSQFPEFHLDRDGVENGEDSCSDQPSTSTTPVGSVTSEHEYSGPSFAKMLQTPVRPFTRKTEDNASASGTTAKARKTSESEQESDDHVPIPTFNQSFRDAVAIALEKAALKNDDSNGGQSSGKKKKNKQKRILFSTSMAYSGK